MQKNDSGQYEIINLKAGNSQVAGEMWINGDVSTLMAEFGMVTLSHLPVAEWSWDAGQINFPWAITSTFPALKRVRKSDF